MRTVTKISNLSFVHSIDTIRLLAFDVEKAHSSSRDANGVAFQSTYLLYMRHLKHNPTNPDWAKEQDRFILSCGHAS